MARARRAAPEARAQIIAVAREHLLSRGPSALRLQEVAKDAGISHPTLLHHFGSREGLVAAVVTEAIAGLDAEIEAILSASSQLDPEPVVLAVAKVLTEGGYGRLLAWLALSAPDSLVPAQPLPDIVELVHSTRMRLMPEGGPSPSRDQSAFLARLVTVAMVGDAIFGEGVCQRLGLPLQGGQEEFQRRLVELLRGALSPGATTT